MYTNKLYYFIKNILFYSKEFDKTKLIFRQNINQQIYAMYLLNNRHSILENESSAQSFCLLSHHISFYEYNDKNTAHLSQYHYTAIFESLTDKKKYQVHVYFNEWDQLTTSPIFSVQNDQEQYLPQEINTIFSGLIYEFAVNHCAEFMRAIRQEFNQHLTKLEQEYNQIELSLAEISKDLIANKDQYLIQLEHCKKCLNTIVTYHDNPYYRDVARLLNRYILPDSKPQLVTTLNEHKEENDITADDQDKSIKIPVIKPLQNVIQDLRRIIKSIDELPMDSFSDSKNIINSLREMINLEDASLSTEQLNQIRLNYLSVANQLITEAAKYFKSSTKSNDINEIIQSSHNKLNMLSQLYVLIQDLILTTDNKRLSYSDENIGYLQTKLKRTHDIGRNLLMTILLNKESLLEEMLQHTQVVKLLDSLIEKIPVPETLIKLAILKGNAVLLDFLLNHYPFAINTYLMNEDDTPVLFCFYNHSEKLSLVKCLSVLIKHHASLMITARDGLPVAYHILDTVDHPLTAALIENTNSTLGHANFYKILIGQLNQFIKSREMENKPIDTNKKNQILKFIDHCGRDSEFVNANLLPPNKYLNQKILSSTAKISAKLSTSIKEAIKADPEVQAISKTVSDLLKEYLKQTSTEQKRHALTHGSKELTKNVDDILEESNFTDFNEYKSHVIQYYNAEIKWLTLMIELNNIKSIILSTNVNNKQRKKAQSREKEIIKELKKLDNDSRPNKKEDDLTHFFRNRGKLAQYDKEMDQCLKDFEASDTQSNTSEQEQNTHNDKISETLKRMTEIMDKKIAILDPHGKVDKSLTPAFKRKH